MEMVVSDKDKRQVTVDDAIRAGGFVSSMGKQLYSSLAKLRGLVSRESVRGALGQHLPFAEEDPDQETEGRTSR
jgi:hypothetical protein